MPRTVTALVEPALLVWTRKTAHVTVAEAAKVAGVEPTVLEGWERGDGAPSLSKLRKLAEKYKRPLAVFYLPEPPLDFAPLKDFRRLPGEVAGIESAKLAFAIRRSQTRREAALELFSESDGKPPAFDLRADLKENDEVVGTRLRDWLGVTLDKQFAWSEDQHPFIGWRTALEDKGVLVFQAPGIDVGEMRGFSIADFPLPAITVNSKDVLAGRTFTLLHELSHLALRITGLCDMIEIAPRPPEEQRVEVYCNAVAAAALMPRNAFLAEPPVKEKRRPDDWPDDVLKAVGDKYGTSKVAVLRRLLTFGLTTPKYYQQRVDEWEEDFRNNPPPKRKMRVTQARKVVNSSGPLFVRLVLEAYYRRTITGGTVADYLGMKLKHLDRIEQIISRRSKIE